MIDERSKKTIETLLPEVQPIFVSFLAEAQLAASNAGYKYIAINGTRSWEEQEAVYAQGRTTPGKIVSNAPPGYSYHNFGMAIDCGVFLNGKYLDGSSIEMEKHDAIRIHTLVSKLAAPNNLTWGGTFAKPKTDYPHFQYNTKFLLSELRSQHEKGIKIKAF